MHWYRTASDLEETLEEEIDQGQETGSWDSIRDETGHHDLTLISYEIGPEQALLYFNHGHIERLPVNNRGEYYVGKLGWA